MLPRADGHDAVRLAPSAALGLLVLLFALRNSGIGLGVSLFLGGGTYVAFLVAAHARIDAAAPLVAVLLILCGELAAWSLDERSRMRVDTELVWQRGAAVGLLALGGLALATLVVALTALPVAHGLAWTFLGSLAAVGAAGVGVAVSRR